MFGLFSKKKKGLIVHDQIYMTNEAKFKACATLKKTNHNITFVAWFEETRDDLETYFRTNDAEVEVYLADRLSLMQYDHQLIFVEHHPLQSEEQRIAAKFAIQEITVFSSLSEPIFQLFGADKMVDLMKKMGMKDDEMIENDMITNSIMKAQEKIASKSTINVSARSQKEWLQNAGLEKL